MKSHQVVDIDVKNRSAKVLVPYFSGNFEDREYLLEVFNALVDIPDIILMVDGLRLDVSIEYDFGKVIPEKLWNTFCSPLFDSFPTEKEELTKETILEAVRHLYPSVAMLMRESAKKLKERILTR